MSERDIAGISHDERCPICKEPADMFVFYNLLDVTTARDIECSFGCYNCHTLSARRKINKEIVARILEKMQKVL